MARRPRPMHERLRGLARSFGFDDETALDMAASAMLVGLEKGAGEWEFMAGVLRNLVKREKKQRVRWKPEHLFDHLPKLTTPASQDYATAASEALAIIGRMAEPDRTIMLLTAQEWSGPEIAQTLNLPVREVNYIITRARSRMRDHTDEHQAMKARHGYVGICKCRRKWRAAVKKGGVNHVAGYFYDPEEAARAYDDLARSLGVPEHKLNFQAANDQCAGTGQEAA